MDYLLTVVHLGQPEIREVEVNQMNDTNLEERVQALEFQMANVHEDITGIEQEVTDLEVDEESQITNIESQITVILADQVNQDDQLEDLEMETETLSSSITDLQTSDFEMNLSINELDSRVMTLESLNGTDEDVLEVLHELQSEVDLLNGTVEGLAVSVLNLEEAVVALEQTDEALGTSVNELDSRVSELELLNDDVANSLNNLDTRLSKLELIGTLAFHGALSTKNPDIPAGSVLVYDVINLNLGGGYNAETGQFIVPSGGAGLYYTYAHFEGDDGETSNMYLRHNGIHLCRAYLDENQGGDFPGSSCGFVAVLQEGQ